jgi:hypothetical protein
VTLAAFWNSPIWTYLALAVGLLLVVAIVVTFVQFVRKHRRMWGELAEEHGMDLETAPAEAFLEGEYRGRAVHLSQERMGPEEFWTTCRVELGDRVPASAYLMYEEFGTDLGEAMGGGAMEIDDEFAVGRDDLDRAFVIRGSDRDTVRAFLDDDAVADALLDARERFDGVLVVDGELIAVTDTIFGQREKLQAYLDAAVDRAEAIDQATAPDTG